MSDLIAKAGDRLLELGVAGIVIIALFWLVYWVASYNRQLQRERLDDAKAELERERQRQDRK